MDVIRVGLDFGTHQTKICIQRTPDEGHGEPNYEFFTFEDFDGKKQFFLPSLIQINEDDTLSYGYVDSRKEKSEMAMPQLETIQIESNFDIAETADKLYDKYATTKNTPDDLVIIGDMLKIRKRKLLENEEKERKEALERYQKKLEEFKKGKNVFRYFKQATFTDIEWKGSIDSDTLCIWYLSYVIFLLEREFGTDFSINMGVPADEKTYEQKRLKASSILVSAYKLVEDIYENDMDRFLAEKVDDLWEKTDFILCSSALKEDYNINIFPEAYASLIGLTSRGKLTEGMSLTADIGGGTTDVSFFTIQEGHPVIYRYWSIPRGLNYIAESSGFDYSEGHFEQNANKDVIDKFYQKRLEIVDVLVNDLTNQLRKETNIPAKNLRDALKNRILVYNGGGSTYKFLTVPISYFSDVKLIDGSIWKEENMKDKYTVSKLCLLLTTAYGLSVSNDDHDVKLKKFTSLFSHLKCDGDSSRIQEIDKDVC